MAKNVVFLTGERIGENASESLHLYRRIVSFKKGAEVAIITSSDDRYAEQAGCKNVIHLNDSNGNYDEAVRLTKQADMFVVVGMAPNVSPSTTYLEETRPECCIAIINQGCMELPKKLNRENVVRMRDMSIGTGLMFLSMYQWIKDLAED